MMKVILALCALASFCLVANAIQTNTITVQFDLPAIKAIRAAQQSVVIARQGGASLDDWHTIWASLSPEASNFFSWNSSGLSLCVVDSPLIDGTQAIAGSSIHANPGLLYTNNWGFFGEGESDPRVSANEVGVFNNDTTDHVFGLSHPIQVNSNSWQDTVIVLEEVMAMADSVFSVNAPVLIFLGPNNVQSGQMAKNLETISYSAITAIDWTSSNNIYVTYDDIEGTFGCTQCKPFTN